MKIIIVTFFLVVNVVSLFAQQNTDTSFRLRSSLPKNVNLEGSLFSDNLADKSNFCKSGSLMFASHGTYLSSRPINMAHINSCPGTIAPPFVFIGGLYAGYLAYDSFKCNETKDAYTFLGISTVLIAAPVIYVVYCSRHKYSSGKYYKNNR